MRWLGPVAVAFLFACGGVEEAERATWVESEATVPLALANGRSRTLTADRGVERHYYLDVPAGATGLFFEISGGTGDADLYLRFGEPPTQRLYDHRPFTSGNNEKVTPVLRAGRWYLMVRAFRAFSAVRLKGQFEPPPAPSTRIENGARFVLGASQGLEQHFHLEVPPRAANLRVAIRGGTGDADLYLRAQGQPTTTLYDHRPYRRGLEEVVEVPAPSAGRWQLMVRAFRDYADVELEVSHGFDPVGRRAIEDEVLRLMNEHRAQGARCGATDRAPAPPLRSNERLRAAARGHSEDMARTGVFAHTSQDGRRFDQRIRDAGYSGPSPWGENIAAGQNSARGVVDGWMNSPGHCLNIMNPAFEVVGTGYAFSADADLLHYWTQDFGGG